MAQISFLAGDFGIQNLNGSGLGFYGSSFGSSVNVGSYQDSTWITNSNGTTQGPQVNNIKRTHPSSGSINGLASIGLTSIPNYLATLQIRFNHSSAVKTQNGKIYCYDRSNINNNPSGVTCYMAEIIHPNTAQTATGSGDSTWVQVFGSGSTLSMASSPGLSGLSPNGPSTTDMNHDFFVCLSASPDSVGSKTQFGLYFETEYY